ncbi:MAG: hypothetical protein JXA37_06660 [Chloroflexia bacterium]|nr:hypothetical protein [Chloroflexia bacterium]
MVPLAVQVFPQHYQDSVSLARLARTLRRLPGVRDVAVVMGTAANLCWLSQSGLLEETLPDVVAEDLLVCVQAETESLAEQALSRARALLRERHSDWRDLPSFQPHSLRTACRTLPEAELALISVRGRYAARLAWEALDRGLHVMLFSGGLSLEEERALKEAAAHRALLFLGPAAGAAVLQGLSLGFASILPRGRVGLLGTDGSGIQQVAALIVREERAVGISQALAVGTRDLTAAIGGRSMEAALALLLRDPETQLIVLLGLQAHPAVARRLLDLLQQGGKPAVVLLPGLGRETIGQAGLTPARTFQEAALLAVALDQGLSLESVQRTLEAENEGLYSQAQELGRWLVPQQRYLRGLYSTTSLCWEALSVLNSFVGEVRSNLFDHEDRGLDLAGPGLGHRLLYMGAEEFTQTWLHPTLDCSQRSRRLLQEAEEPGLALILLDVLLGVGAHSDPVGEMAPAIQSARAIANARGCELLVLASVCGTRSDPQDLWSQEEKLRDAGAIVLPSNTAAAKLAGLMMQGRL